MRAIMLMSNRPLNGRKPRKNGFSQLPQSTKMGFRKCELADEMTLGAMGKIIVVEANRVSIRNIRVLYKALRIRVVFFVFEVELDSTFECEKSLCKKGS